MKTTKLERAFSALREARGDVSRAKAKVASMGYRISARTWYKAIQLSKPEEK